MTQTARAVLGGDAGQCRCQWLVKPCLFGKDCFDRKSSLRPLQSLSDKGRFEKGRFQRLDPSQKTPLFKQQLAVSRPQESWPRAAACRRARHGVDSESRCSRRSVRSFDSGWITCQWIARIRSCYAQLFPQPGRAGRARLDQLHALGTYTVSQPSALFLRISSLHRAAWTP